MLHVLPNVKIEAIMNTTFVFAVFYNDAIQQW